MKKNAPRSDEGHVFRSEIEVFRGPYYVTYRPAQHSTPFGIINVVYKPESAPAPAKVKQAMVDELRHWVARYRVPTMVTAWAGDDPIPLGNGFTYLLVYEVDGKLREAWRRYGEPELSLECPSPQELAEIYHDVPFRIPSEVRRKGTRELVGQARGARMIVFLMVGFPLLIEIAALGITWLGHLMAAISLAAGSWKLGRTVGWIKPTERELAKQKDEQEMQHHHYHCKRNPEAFLALKTANFKKELAEREQATFRRIKATAHTPLPK